MGQAGRGTGSSASGEWDAEEKVSLRKLILEKRRALSDHERRKKSLLIRQRLLNLEEFRVARIVHFFLSFRGEVLTDDLVRQALALGKRVVVPVVKGPDELIFSELRSYPEEVEPGAFGIPEPKEGYIRPMAPTAIDLFVLPGVAFDREGNRLGYGAGYYDRILGKAAWPKISDRVPRIALAFELQLVDRVPSSVQDLRVDKIVTEERVIECLKTKRSVHGGGGD